MRRVKYGEQTIEYSALVNEGLKSHYIIVERQSGVVLKGSKVLPEVADRLILKKAKWIVNKLDQVRAVDDDKIVTGSRLPYLGKSYYVEIINKYQAVTPNVEFTYSKFKIHLNTKNPSQEELNNVIDEFYKARAVEKITSRFNKVVAKTKHHHNGLSFRKMNKRWGSCTTDNKIIINYDAIKLPYSLIDYLLVHELCHTKYKDHSKAYWAELSKHVPNWRELDERVKEFKF